MTATADSDTRTANPSTLRVRRHRERRRQGICLFTVEVPRALIEAAIARGLLKPVDCLDAWKVVLRYRLRPVLRLFMLCCFQIDGL
jgi:hypothetical protein